MSDYTLVHGDCLDKMSQIDDGSIDMICADLPYGTTACKWDTIIPFEPLWKHYKRVIKRNGAVVLFGSEPFSSFLRLSNLGWYKYDWVWDKKAVSNFQLANVMPLRRHEDVIVFCNGKSIYYPQMIIKNKPIDKRNWNLESKRVDSLRHLSSKTLEPGRRVLTHSYPTSVIELNSCNAECNGLHRLHPTQKPVALLEYLIRTYTNEGELILDNTFGSCSTGEAALRTGRRFIGIEKDETYYQIGVDRMVRVAAELRGELSHLPMFAGVTP